MFIEFFGMPGSGKTYISDKLYCNRDFIKKNEVIKNINELTFKDQIKVLIKYRITVLIILTCIISLQNFNEQTRMISRFLKRLAYADSIKKEKNIYVFDELIIQSIWSIFLKFPFDSKYFLCQIIKRLEPVYNDNELIYVIRNERLCLKGISERNGTSRFDKMNEHDKERYFERGILLMDIIKTCVDERFNTKIIVND